MKNISFLSENFQFFKMKFSIYLNRRVFVMVGNEVPAYKKQYDRASRKHTYIILTPVNSTFI